MGSFSKVLNKRLPRDFKTNFGRYLALILLIVMGVFLVVSMVGAAETIIKGTENKKSENRSEDGQFTVFLPLTDKEIEKLSENGTVVEEMFYMDLPAENSGNDDNTAIIRMFKNRENIDLTQLDEGRLADGRGEAGA